MPLEDYHAFNSSHPTTQQPEKKLWNAYENGLESLRSFIPLSRMRVQRACEEHLPTQPAAPDPNPGHESRDPSLYNPEQRERSQPSFLPQQSWRTDLAPCVEGQTTGKCSLIRSIYPSLHVVQAHLLRDCVLNFKLRVSSSRHGQLKRFRWPDLFHPLTRSRVYTLLRTQYTKLLFKKKRNL
ncbi:hypothetical protein T439DRAFT_43874 [Meredithblackwellia eburnea MCA 4105]